MISISLQIDMNLVGYVVCELMVHCRCNDSSIGMLPVTMFEQMLKHGKHKIYVSPSKC